MLWYEEFKCEKMKFLQKLSEYIGFFVDEKAIVEVEAVVNPSVSGLNAKLLRYLNKFFRSEKQPFLLFPRYTQKVLSRLLAKYSFASGVSLIPSGEVQSFCEDINRLDVCENENLSQL